MHGQRHGRLPLEQLTEGDNSPWGIEADVVDPEVEKFGPGVRHAVETLLSPVGGVVEGHSVEVGDADDDLEDVPRGMVGADAEDCEEAERAPDELTVAHLH